MNGNTCGIDFEFYFDDDFGIVFECTIFNLLIICWLKKNKDSNHLVQVLIVKY
jgi:hypothetical protein